MARPVPRFATCSITSCGNPSVRGKSCTICRRHLCAQHVQKIFHKCPSKNELSEEDWEQAINDEVSKLLGSIKTEHLEKRASALNNGRKCTFVPGRHLGNGAIMGCANYHAWLTFDNGEKWIVRVPRNNFSDTPDTLIEYLVSSEYATLKFLQQTRVPAPTVFGFGLASDPANLVGVSYLLMEVIPGKPYSAYDSTPGQRRQVMDQLALILAELKLHPLPRIGSLFLRDDGQIDVGPVASNRFVTLGEYGPFNSESNYFDDVIQQQCDLIADRQLYVGYPTEALAYYEALRRDLQRAKDTQYSGGQLEGFYLKHVDDKGDHLLVDEDGRITGIIDWQFARSVPACEAFGPSLVTADLESLYKGDVEPSDDDTFLASALGDHGETILARYAGQDGRIRRLNLGLASGLREADAKTMLSMVRSGVEVAESEIRQDESNQSGEKLIFA